MAGLLREIFFQYVLRQSSGRSAGRAVPSPFLSFCDRFCLHIVLDNIHSGDLRFLHVLYYLLFHRPIQLC